MKHPLLTSMALAGLVTLQAVAAPTFAPVLQDHMVLQRGAPVTLWGSAAEGETVTVVWKGHSATTTATDGQWVVTFPACEAAATGSSIHATDSTGTAMLEDILVGDVWLASGQSNMEWRIRQDVPVPADINTNNTLVRLHSGKSLLHVHTPQPYSDTLYRRALAGEGCHWDCHVCSPASIHDFSAVGVCFALSLQEHLRVPVGIICNAVGGSPMESWIASSTLKSKPRYAKLHDSGWLDWPEMEPWVRKRARQNLAPHIARGEQKLLHPYAPGYLHRHAVEPLAGLAFRGVIWYQGEANAETTDIELNATKMEDLIRSWRSTLRDDTLPFLMVQLPRINAPTRPYWAEFREAQAEAARKLPGVGLICTIDLGSTDSDVHPRAKAPVGQRLAILARRMVYGEATLPTYPSVTGWQAEGNTLHITFDQMLSTADGAAPRGFVVGRPKERTSFAAVPATLKGNTITLTLPHPWTEGMAWRYIHTTFAEPNLVGAQGGLPAFPARSESSTQRAN